MLAFEVSLLLRDNLESLRSIGLKGLEKVDRIITGKHIEIIHQFDGTVIDLRSLVDICLKKEDPYESFADAILEFCMKNTETLQNITSNLQDVFLYAVALLEIYCQANYTGPELSNVDCQGLCCEILDEAANKGKILQELECDGLYPYQVVDVPHLLLLSRIILSFLANPMRVSWKEGILISETGKISLPYRTLAAVDADDNDEDNDHNPSSLPADNISRIARIIQEHFTSFAWWSSRALIYHLRVLQQQPQQQTGKSGGSSRHSSYLTCPTLWQDIHHYYFTTFQAFTVIAKLPTTAEEQPQEQQADKQADKQGGNKEYDIWSMLTTAAPLSQPVDVTLIAKMNWMEYSILPANILRSLPAANNKNTDISALSHLTPLLTPSQCQQLLSNLLVEYGLACHYFLYGDQGQRAFLKVKEILQLTTYLTAAMGKRTKYQRQDVAQLLLYAKSGLSTSGSIGVTAEATVAPTVAVAADTSTAINSQQHHQQEGDGQHSSGNPTTFIQPMSLEIGRRTIQEAGSTAGTAGGKPQDEAAMREVLLDQVDTGVENIIFEGGPQFSSVSSSALALASASATAVTTATASNSIDRGGRLTAHDQIILLALCLTIQNNLPAQDALTHEEMLAYIERILYDHTQPTTTAATGQGTAIEPAAHTNWMIYSTALLERSWIEFEKRKTADRAMLQIQALIDQHSTRLTITQASFASVSSVSESAPLASRLLYLYQLVYPSLFEIKKDLAYKYLSCQIFMSALQYFKELALWDEVVTCYQLMQKPTKAELIVREQLALQAKYPSPYMLTSLGDLTGKEEYYQQAWIVSKKRFARAKRTLGKIAYDRQDYPAAIGHFTEALAVQPLVYTAWYLKGICCMRCSRWEEGLQAFVRVIQQEEEVGEAWTNMSAIHLHMSDYPKAYHALSQALKWKRDDWRVLEIMLTVCMQLRKWKDCLLYMSYLIDVRYKQQAALQKSNRAGSAGETADDQDGPLHVRELYHVCVKISAMMNRIQVDEDYDIDSLDYSYYASGQADDSQQLATWPSEAKEKVTSLTELTIKSEQLLEKITSTLKTSATIWDIVARFHRVLGRYQTSLEARVKQFRAIVSDDSKWMRDQKKLQQMITVGQYLYDAVHFQEVQVEEIYELKMLLQTISRQMETVDSNDTVKVKIEYREQIQEIVQRMDKLYQLILQQKKK